MQDIATQRGGASRVLGLFWLFATAIVSLIGGAIAFARRRRTTRQDPAPVERPTSQVSTPFPWPDWALVGIGAISLVLAGIVAIRQTSILENQTRIAELQADLMRTQYLPAFQLKLDAVPDPQEPNVTRERLTITNTGGLVRDFVAGPIAFVEISEPRVEEEKVLESIVVGVPFVDYYGGPWDIINGVTGNAQGDVAFWLGPYLRQENSIDNANIETVANEIAQWLQLKAYGYAWSGKPFSYRVAKYVDLYYTDIFGENHREIYRVSSNGFGRIDDEKTRLILDRWSFITSNDGSYYYARHSDSLFISVETPNAEQIFYAWKTLREQQGYPVPEEPIFDSFPMVPSWNVEELPEVSVEMEGLISIVKATPVASTPEGN